MEHHSLHTFFLFIYVYKYLSSGDSFFIDLIFFPFFQGDFDPVTTQVIHLKMNPTAVAKQQRQQEAEALREEVTLLRERVRMLQDGGSLLHSQDEPGVHGASRSFSLPPSKEVQGKTCTGHTWRYCCEGTGSKHGSSCQLIPNALANHPFGF